MSEIEDLQRLLNVKEIQVGAGSTVFKVNKEGLFLGSDNYTDAPFSVSFAGVLKATSGIFSGTLSAAAGSLGAITIGSNAWHVDSSGNMWWGNFASYAAASVKISSAGAAYFSSGTFSGSLNGATITGATGTFTGDLTGATGTFSGTISASNITAGTITGCTVQSSSGDNKIVLATGDSLTFYYGGNSVGSIISNSAAGVLLRGASIDLSNTAESQGIHTFTGTGPYFAPKQNNTWGLGTSSYAWQDVYAYVFHDLCLWLDEEDDLSILKNCKPMVDDKGKYILSKEGKPRMDNSSLPEWMQSGKNEDGDTWRNMGHFVDLIAGSVRQLADRLDKLESK